MSNLVKEAFGMYSIGTGLLRWLFTCVLEYPLLCSYSVPHADPYVKVYLIYKGKRLGKWKTKVKKNTLVPVFNESFQFLIPGLNMKDLMLQVVVMDYDRFSRNDHVGIVDLGCDVSNDSGRNHWIEIISNPKEPISHWHPILQAKKKSRKSKQPSTATNLPMCLSPQR